MNIRSIQCPSCGANLKLENVNQSIIFCQFCGASIQLETNHNKGYDMELGRLDARAELADKLLEKIEKIKPELIRNGKAERDTKYYPQAISSEKATLSVERTSGWKEAYLNSNAEVDILRKFRNDSALTYFIKGLKAREFVSLDQAVFRYEETMGTADNDYDF
ncbi:MAG: hypothetical protein J5522_05930 [Lachnospiraceae bacterium]|nr:hypothetical protein [Lachnospiraceae bacterium]